MTSECSSTELWAKREGCDAGVLLKFYSENKKMQSSNLVPNILPAVISSEKTSSSQFVSIYTVVLIPNKLPL